MGTTRAAGVDRECETGCRDGFPRGDAEGARFFDKKTGTVADFCAALYDLALGRRYFSPSFITAKAARHANPESFEKILSPAEQRVLALVGEGLSDQEIGARLGITPATAQKHRSRLLKNFISPLARSSLLMRCGMASRGSRATGNSRRSERSARTVRGAVRAKKSGIRGDRMPRGRRS